MIMFIAVRMPVNLIRTLLDFASGLSLRRNLARISRVVFAAALLEGG
jgi:hypothetical protein